MEFRAKELIDDKEVAGLDEDRLGHDGVAIQLAELVCSVPTPSNIALYGPWGSGKSGIGNLLATKLKTKSGVNRPGNHAAVLCAAASGNEPVISS